MAALKPRRGGLARLGRARVPVLATAWLLACLVAGGLLAWLADLDHLLDRRHDWQASTWAPPAPPRAAVVVDVDEASLRRLGVWPLRRDTYAPAGRWLQAQGARAVVFGLLLVDAREGDAEFARWLGEGGPPVLLGARSLAGEGDGRQPAGLAPLGCRTTRFDAWQLPVWARNGAEAPALPVQRVGALSAPVDPDGVLRRMALFQQAGDLVLPALPLAVWQALHPGPAQALRCVDQADGGAILQAGDAGAWPLDAQHRLRPWLAPAHDAPPTLPLWRVLAAAQGQLQADDAQALAAAVRGRVVIIGSSAQASGETLTGQGWRHSAPLLAATVDALDQGRVLAPPGRWTDHAWLLALGLPWLAALWLGPRWTRRQPLRLLAVVLMATALLLAADTALVAVGGQLSRLGWPLAALGCMAVSLGWAWRQQALRARLALERARHEAAARARVKSDFIAQVSHEVRTPLTALMGAAELLAATPLNDGQRRYVNLFSSAGQELLQMLDDLLDLSKSEAGLLALERMPFSLTQVVAEQVALFEAKAAQKGLSLDIDTNPDLPEAVVGDPQRVAQVLRNLLANAVKFTSVGRITLVMGFGRDREHVRFEVRDTGVGIPADRLDRLFAPYSQLHEGALRQGGTGLGLAISRRLVELMGGRIGVQSREGLGSIFQVELPLPATAADPVPSEHLAARSRAAGDPTPLGAHGVSGLRVLAADDNALNLMLLRAFLEGAGHVVDAVPDGAAALRLFERGGHQVVLLDLNMPVMDGVAAVRAMRAHEARRGRTPARIVAVSGEADGPSVALALAAGFDAHLAKPYTRDQLLGVVADGGELARLLAGSQPGALPSAANSAWTDRLSRLPDSNLPEAVQRMGSTALYDRVLEAAREPLLSFEDQLAQALDAMPCDLDVAHRLAHNLKTLAATLGLPGLSADARRLERALDQTVAPSHDEAVRGARAQVMARLQPVCAALQRTPPVGRRAAGG